jgi:vacuolar-type H+-ATPase subunit E/Vma4
MFSSFVPPINYPSINPPVIRLPDLDVGIGDLGDLFKKKSKDSALTLAKFLVDVNIKTDLKQQLEPLIQEAFNKLESFLKDIASAAENLLGKSKVMLEDLIKQALKGLSDLLTDVEQKVSNILSQAKLLAEGIIDKVRKDLLDGFFDKVDSLRKALINDLKKLIQDAKQAGEDLLYKGDKIVTGTIASLKDDIDKLASDLEEQLDIRKWFDPDERLARKQEEQREDFCKRRIGATGIAFSTLGSAQFYEYRQCVTLKRLNDAVELSGGKVTIRNMKLVYADLNDRAWKLACVGRAEGSALQDIALADWIKFGQLFQLWNQFEDDMEVLEVINKRMDQLQKEIDTARTRSVETQALLQGKKVCVGQTPAGSTAWQPYEGGTSGIFVDVDTSAYGFTSTPIYVVNMHGDSTNWEITGGSSPYNRTEKGFRIYVRFWNGNALTPEFANANERKWHIQWIAVGN